MKAVLKALMVIGLAAFVAGWYYAESRTEYETIVYHEVARTGDTLDGVLEQYWSKTDGRTWQEFRYNHMERNKVHFANGRALQPGDIICIEVRQPKHK